MYQKDLANLTCFIPSVRHRRLVVTDGLRELSSISLLPTPSMPTPSGGSQDYQALLIDTVVESWRFSRLFARVIGKLDAGEAARYVNQLRFFQRRIEENLGAAGFTLVNVEGLAFDAGMAASALNLGDFGPDDDLLVEQMVEPIIMGNDGLKKTGTVILRQAHK